MTDLAVPPELAALTDYTDLRPLGRGGMGLVFAGTQTLMGRPVVLKLLAPHVASDAAAAERFLREIRAAATLDHPNVVKAYAAHQVNGRLVLVMEFVPGDDLAKVVADRGALTPTHASYYAYQAAMGLQHAHERGMVHRDIKPGNLLLARVAGRSVVKVADFGLAKAAREADETRLGLTHTGQLMGSPHYLAPEQAVDAHAADTRSDVYSLGCTLYHLLAGRPPFDGASMIALVDAHRAGGAKPLDKVRSDVPPELAAVVARMMARWPTQRYPTPGEAAKALKPFFKPGEGSTEATPVRAMPATATPRPVLAAEQWRPPTVFRGTTVPTDTAYLNPEDFGPASKPKPPKTRRASKPPAVPVFGLVVAGCAVAAVAVLMALVAVAARQSTPATPPEVAGITKDEAAPEPAVSTPVPAADDPAPPFDPAPFEKATPKARKGRATDRPGVAKATPTPPPRDNLMPAAEARRRADADTRKAAAAGKGLMRTEGRELVLRRSEAGQVWPLVGDPDWTDYDVTVRVKGTYGPCLVVRANYPADGGPLQAGLYTAGWSGDRVVSLAGLRNGVPLTAKTQDIGSVLGANTWRLMGVSVRGDAVESYLDGVPMLRGKPPMPPRGMVGLRVADVGTVRFADLTVRAPDGTVLFEGLPDVPR